MTQGFGIHKLKWAEYPRTETGKPIVNPFCGLYVIYRFVAGEEIMPQLNVPIEDCPLEDDQRLCLVEINLNPFQDGPISQMGLRTVDRILTYFSRQKKMLLLRFLYDWEGRNIQTEPKQIQTIFEHMDQLAPLLQKHSAWIYILQGLFVGSWGEMHNSRYLAPTSLCDLGDHLLRCVGEETFLAVRSPSLWRTVVRSFDPVDDRDAYSDRSIARIGLFNDGMLASSTDYGTYGSMHRLDAQMHGDKLCREEELIFQQKLCQYVPNGGEVLNPCPQNDFERAVTDLAAMHVSYLNGRYDEAVLDKWRACVLRRHWGVWRGMTGYDYIVAHLGYRYLIDEVKLSVLNAEAGILRAQVKVRNTGFSVCYRRLKVEMVVRDALNFQRYTEPLDTDARKWFPEQSIALACELDASDWKGRKMLLCISACDPLSGECVQFANAFSYVGSDGDCLLGAFFIKD